MVKKNTITEKLKSRPFIFFLAPGLVLYLMFVVYPIITTVYNSLTQWDGLNKPKFIGLDNYITLFTNSSYAHQLYNAIINGVVIVILCYIIQLPLAFYFAWMIDKGIRGANFFKLIIFLPQVISVAAVSLLVLLFLDPSFGAVNNLLTAVGLDSWTKGWLGETALLKPIVSIVLTWKGIGIPMMIILANLQSIPKEYLESAQIDGAGEFKTYIKIILPMLIPSLSTTCIMIFLGGIAAFDAPYLIGGINGGPQGACDTLGTMFYRIAFGQVYLTNNVGLGTAVAVIEFSIMIVVSAFQITLFRKREIEYQ